MPTLTINGKSVTVDRGTSILRAAAMLGINIPHFCYHPSLSAPANCRMCLVEIEKARKLEPACYAKVADGMVVHTESEKVVAARKAVLEFILINHPVDCPICDQAGECKLQDYYVAYDAQPSRLTTRKVAKAKVFPIGPHVVYDGERCILCTRCVRFCDEITGTSELTVVERGDHSEIRTFPGRELDNPYSMNVTDLCPVGALTTRDFRFKCRVWLMSSTDSVCTGCARGCNVHLEHFQGEVQRYRPRFNPEVNEYWMCDVGRQSYKELHRDRLTQLRIPEQTTDEISWPRAMRKLGVLLTEKMGDTRDDVALVVSPRLSTESLLAAQLFAEEVLKPGRVYTAGRPDGDADAFLILADKNPNRAGLAALFGQETLERTNRQLLNDLRDGSIRKVWYLGADTGLTGADEDAFIEALSNADFLVQQSAWRGRIAEHAHVLLPSTTHAEHNGTFVNADGMVQTFHKAFDPQGQNLPDWEIFVRLARGCDTPLRLDSLQQLQEQLFSAHAD